MKYSERRAELLEKIAAARREYHAAPIDTARRHAACWVYDRVLRDLDEFESSSSWLVPPIWVPLLLYGGLVALLVGVILWVTL